MCECAHTFKFMPMPKRWLWQICHAPLAALPCGNLGKGAGEEVKAGGEGAAGAEAGKPVAHCDPKVDPEKRLLWFAWLVCLFIGQRGAFYANPKINTQVFIISMHTAHTHTHSAPQTNRNKVEKIKAKQTKREKPKLKPVPGSIGSWQAEKAPFKGSTNDREGAWGVGGAKSRFGIVWDAQRVNNYNVQIVWCMSPATFALLLLIRNAQRALRRIKNKSHSKHRHARTHEHTRTRTHTESQLTTMTPSINSGRVDVCYAELHCEKRLIEQLNLMKL